MFARMLWRRWPRGRPRLSLALASAWPRSDRHFPVNGHHPAQRGFACTPRLGSGLSAAPLGVSAAAAPARLVQRSGPILGAMAAKAFAGGLPAIDEAAPGALRPLGNGEIAVAITSPYRGLITARCNLFDSAPRGYRKLCEHRPRKRLAYTARACAIEEKEVNVLDLSEAREQGAWQGVLAKTR